MILEAALVASLAAECAPNVEPATMQALIFHESSANPYAIGVVGTPLVEQPSNKEDAIATAKSLIDLGANISLGLGQINYKNLPALNMSIEDAFEFCPNIKAADEILSSCFVRATKDGQEGQGALQSALSCYYSNNFRRGLVREKEFGDTSYVERIAKQNERLVPSIQFSSNDVRDGEADQGKVQTNSKIKQEAIEDVTGKDDNWDVFQDF